MSKIIDYMKELDLTTFEKINCYFTQTPIDVIQCFDEHMGNLAYEDWSIAEYSPYSFSPSMDLSGFGGCSELECKKSRAINFSKFASLYSDTVYFIVNSITNQSSLNIDECELLYRQNLVNDYSLILLYSQLIEKNIAKIIPPHFNICPDCFSKYIENKNELQTLNPIIDEYSIKAVIEATFYDKNEHIGFFEIKNLPELFPEHNGYMLINGGPCLDYLEKAKKFPMIIQDEQINNGIIKEYVYENYLTSKYEALVSSLYQAKFVTSKPFDKTMIDLSSRQTISSIPSPVFDMPFFSNIDIQTILKFRETEYHAFNDYRIALDKATKSYVEEPSQLNAIYDDIIYPAFVKLDEMFERTKRMRIAKNISGLLVIGSTVTLGLMNSVVPANPLGIATALGGTGALVRYVGDVVERKLTTDNELEKQDFYFLWKLKRK